MALGKNWAIEEAKLRNRLRFSMFPQTFLRLPTRGNVAKAKFPGRSHFKETGELGNMKRIISSYSKSVFFTKNCHI